MKSGYEEHRKEDNNKKRFKYRRGFYGIRSVRTLFGINRPDIVQGLLAIKKR